MCFNFQIFHSGLENREISEENTRLECDKEMLQSSNTQLIEEKHQLETSVMQAQAENNQQNTEINQLRNYIATERIQLESHHNEEKLHLESRHQREKQLLQSEVERLTKQLERIKTVPIDKKSLVSLSVCFFNSISQVQSPYTST